MAKRDAQTERDTRAEGTTNVATFRTNGKPATADWFAAELAELGKRQFEALTRAQAQAFDAIEGWHHDCFAQAKSEAVLASDTATQLLSSRSVPETASACQSWLNRRKEMFGENSERFFTDGQKFLEASWRLMSNGRSEAL
jgi:hypothetical protein